jgi:Transposase DDE domain
MPAWTPPPSPDPSPVLRPAPSGPVTVGAIESFVRATLEQLEPDRRMPPGRGRPRVLPALALWGGLLVCLLEGFTRQIALWRLLTSRGLWDYPRFALRDQAIYHRLARDGTAPLEQLFGQVTRVLAERLAPYRDRTLAPFATAVVALDETTLDRVARMLPALRDVPPGDRRLLPGKLSALFDLRQQQFVRVEHQAAASQNEKVAARGMLDGLERGTLLVADLGYFGFAWFDWLTDQGYWWVSRLRLRTSYTVLHRFYDAGRTFDGVVWLGAHRADRAGHAVRLVRFTVGAAEYAYVTNVIDPAVLSIREIARLYARRWDLELAFKLIKRELGLHLLWSAKEVVILQQVWAVLTLAQILHALRLEIAGRAGVDPFEVSLPLLVEYAPRYARDGQDPVAAFVRDGRALGFIRPSRRIVVQAPEIPPEQILPLPPGLVLERPARYAHKDCGPRTRT